MRASLVALGGLLPRESRTPEEIAALVIPALGATAAMVGIVFVVTVVLGTPIAIVLHNTAPTGLFPNHAANQAISVAVNIARSIPFLILMAALIPFTRFLVGTTLGVAGAIVPLSIASIPIYVRLVETSLREVPKSVIEAGYASGGKIWQVITRVQVPEAFAGVVANVTISTVTILEFTAVAGAIGAGGIGYLALAYGYNRFDGNIMLVCVIILVGAAQLIQFTGDALSRRLQKQG